MYRIFIILSLVVVTCFIGGGDVDSSSSYQDASYLLTFNEHPIQFQESLMLLSECKTNLEPNIEAYQAT
jgi:hypothetical protein